jgi:glutathione peroxidase
LTSTFFLKTKSAFAAVVEKQAACQAGSSRHGAFTSFPGLDCSGGKGYDHSTGHDKKGEPEETNMLAQSISAFIVFTLALFTAPAPSIAAETPCPPILDHKFANLMDEPVSLCRFSGKVLLVVNTASECGYTPQYDGLEKIYRRYRDKGFVVLGFPANDFGGQEPGTDKEIAQFCRVNYGITFPVFAKTAVVGAKANPLFRELAAKTGKPPRWNFHKYLLDRKAQPIAAFESAVEPEDRQMTSPIEKLLAVR